MQIKSLFALPCALALCVAGAMLGGCAADGQPGFDDGWNSRFDTPREGDIDAHIVAQFEQVASAKFISWSQGMSVDITTHATLDTQQFNELSKRIADFVRGERDSDGYVDVYYEKDHQFLHVRY